MGFSTLRFSNSGPVFAFLFARSKSTFLDVGQLSAGPSDFVAIWDLSKTRSVF